MLYPFTGGGANWSGASFDPARQLLVVPVQNLAHIVTLEEVGERTTGGGSGRAAAQRHGLRALWWLFTGRGTGDRYRVDPLGGRVVFEHDGVPCNRPPWGRLVAVDLARGAIAWSASTSTRDGDPGSCGYGPALVTASGLVFHGGTREPVLRVHDVAHRRADRHLRPARGPARGPDQLQARARRQAVPRRRAGRSRGRRLAARRRGDRLHAAVTHRMPRS